jgi:hypothetical protein
VARPLPLVDVPAAYRPPLVRDRAGLMREIESRWRELDGVVRALDASALDRQVPGMGEGAATWTVKDVIAHLAAWRRNAAKVAALQAEPDAEPVNNFPGRVLGFRTDDFNAQLLAEWRDRPGPVVLEEHQASYEALVQALAAVPEPRLVIRKRSALWLTPAIGHPRVHLADLRLP